MKQVSGSYAEPIGLHKQIIDRVNIKQARRKLVRSLPGYKTLRRLRGSLKSRMHGARDAGEVFLEHFQRNEWGSSESASGPGSTLEYTENIRKELPGLVEELMVRTILDAPCGDYNWFRAIDWHSDIDYIGGDIVEPLIDGNRVRFEDQRTRFMVLDVIHDPLPVRDLWLCRDCLFHLSERDIFQSLANFTRSRIPYILTSNHPNCDVNIDIPTGAFRQINLTLPPFTLPPPLRVIDDWIEGYPPRHLALWGRESIADALSSNKTYLRLSEHAGSDVRTKAQTRKTLR